MQSEIRDQWFELMTQAEEFRESGDYHQGIIKGEAALKLSESIDIDDLAATLNNLAYLYVCQELYEKAEPLYFQAKEILETIFGSEHTSVATTLNNLAHLYVAQELYGKAEPLYIRSLEIDEKALGTNHLDVAITLNNLADLYKSQKFYKKAEPLYLRALNIKEKVLGDDHPDIAAKLITLADLYELQELHEKAEPLYLRALNIKIKVLGDDHPEVAIILVILADLYKSQELHKKAEPLKIRAREILEANHPELETTLENLTYSLQKEWISLMEKMMDYRQVGNYNAGINIGEKALEIALNLSATELSNTLNNLAELHGMQGLFDEAKRLYEQSLEKAIEEFGNEHPLVARVLNNMSLIYKDQALYDQAEELLQKALLIIEKSSKDYHQDLAEILNNLAVVYRDQALHERIEPLYIKAIAIKKESLGEEHPDVAIMLDNLAGLYKDMKLYDQAKPIYQEALVIKINALGKNHPSVAMTWNNLAWLCCAQGNEDRAMPMYIEALKVKENTMGANHPSVAITLDNLARLYRKEGNYIEAELHLKRALEIKEKAFGEDNPSVGNTLDILAQLYQSQGKYDLAKQFYSRALKILEKTLPSGHPQVVSVLHNLADLYRRQERYKESLELFQFALNSQYHFLQNRLPHISEKEHQIYIEDLKRSLRLIMSLVYRYFNNNPILITSALNTIFLTKALSASALGIRNALLYSDRYSHLQIQLRSIRNLTNRINNLDFNHPARVSILSQIREIEIEIAKAAPEMKLLDSLMINSQSIAHQLPKDSTLIEFIKFNLYDFDKKSLGDAIYLAFILPKSQPDEIQMVDLGDSEDIDKFIKSFRLDIIADFKQLTTALPKIATTPPLKPIPIPLIPKIGMLTKMQEKLITPLLPYLNTSHIVIAPDGDLCHLPFHFLLPDKIVTYLTTGRDLLRTPSPKYPDRSIVVADPDFKQISATPITSLITTASVQSAAIQNLKFDPLPKFGILGKAIAKRLNAQAYYKTTATKTAITNTPCPQILSVLTHGFALDATDDKETDPMVRCGLAFSGANIDKNNLLLANEITTLDLHSNDLTILVACETALGEIKPGEGVYGLRRAFSIAGAKTTIATLWNIPVLASIILVERFFDNLQIRNMEKGAALLDAQKYLQNCSQDDLQQTQSGLDALNELKIAKYDLEGVIYPFSHPYFWAAWICQGESGTMSF